eukprot:CAMPEP_0174988840 /NCGR_PEP_ID=MMETSP0004_2-20121128/20366_1 /TAXON_ID=420556 /ORGANISM="Ochromonas sp., Strain CCMP1393" /LENGTH=411 /DNA_ID=CAMNT_0016242135 /DNA_START=31 /DNA_END=1263 /DNA_ORIENTATION=-
MFAPKATTFGSTANKSVASKRAIARVTKWVEDVLSGLGISDVSGVMVTEIQCYEPDCVPVETLVIVMLSKEEDLSIQSVSDGSTVEILQSKQDQQHGADRRNRWAGKILKPVEEVEKGDVADLDFPIEWRNGSDVALSLRPSLDTSRLQKLREEIKSLIDEYVDTACSDTIDSDRTTSSLLVMAEELTQQAERLSSLAEKTGKKTMVSASVTAPTRSTLEIPVTRVAMQPTINTSAVSGRSSAILPTEVSGNAGVVVPSSGSEITTTTPTAAASTTGTTTSITRVNMQSATSNSANIINQDSGLSSSSRRNDMNTESTATATSRVTTTNANNNITATAAALHSNAATPMHPSSSSSSYLSAALPTALPSDSSSSRGVVAPRHKKGSSSRPRGCPCCDPDNIDNIIDSVMFS